jgi:hypothetical protein
MEFRFDANQEFQVKAIEAVADLFDGPAPALAQVRRWCGTKRCQWSTCRLWSG